MVSSLGVGFVEVDAVNLVISPKIGMEVLSAMKKKGIRRGRKWSWSVRIFCADFMTCSFVPFFCKRGGACLRLGQVRLYAARG